MASLSKALISELQADERFMGTCPSCQEEFRLADAVLFALEDNPPEKALEAINAMRQRVKERKEQLVKDRERMTKRAEKTAHAVNLGKIVEKIVPSFSAFSYYAGDCRALFEPIDYLIFSGLASKGRVESISFVDIKSGNGRLSESQKSIKSAVEAGKVAFSTIHHKVRP